MSWYSSVHEPTKQLNALLETNPSLANLLMFSDFIKLFNQIGNVNLQNYLKNTPNLLNEIVTYISVAPNQSDTIDRKHKLPLLTMQMIQCKKQSFSFMASLILKPTKDNIPCFLAMFDMFKNGKDVLPLLAGYFHRVSLVLNSEKKNQVLELVYSSPQYMELLIAHSYDLSIARTLKQYLSIDLTNPFIKHFPQEKTPLKLTMIRNIMNKIESQRLLTDQRSVCLVSNLLQFIREEVLEKYDMIYHGKSMVEIILAERYVDMIMGLMTEQSENSLPAIKLVFMCLRYYANCCYRMPNQPQDNLRMRVQKLENEPFVRKLINSFKITLQKIKNKRQINLYTYNILNVLCHSIKLPMIKIFNAVKESSLIPILIDLLFRFEDCNILHKLIEGLFQELFLVQNSIYDLYKEYLFCTVSIIDLTAIRLYKLFPEADGYERAKKKGYFGPLIQIINKYSRIMAQTTNPLIKNQINANAEICQKFSQKIMKPHELLWKNKLGEYENVPKAVPLEYAVKKTGNQFATRPFQNAEAVQQVKKQEQGMTKLLQTVIQMNTYTERKNYDDSFYKSPIEDVLNKNSQQPISQYLSSYRPAFSTTVPSTSNQEKPGFHQMMIKFKQQVGQQNRQKKSQSLEKRLSAGKKTRLTSPSPTKKRNSWKQQSEQQTAKQQKAPNLYVNKDLPKVPIANKIPIPSPHANSSIYSSSNQASITNNSHNLAKSSIQEPKKSFEQQSKRMMSLSTANLELLKKTTIIRTTEIPAEKKFRKIQDKDKALFAYLGINC